MLWNSGPLKVGCQDHLVVNTEKLKETAVWELLKVIGFKACSCPEFSLYEERYDVWCFGNRDGTLETARGADLEWEDEEKEEGYGSKWLHRVRRVEPKGS